MKIEILDGQQWYIRFKGHKLCYAGVLKRSKGKKIGAWRKVKYKKNEHQTRWWEIPGGGSSGLPQTLFTPLRDAIFEDITKLAPEKRTFERVLAPTLLGLKRAARLIGFTVRQSKKSRRRFMLLRKGKPTMSFLVVDFHHKAHHDFYQRKSDGEPRKNRKGKQVRNLKELSLELRARPDTKVQHLEENSRALLRWLIVVFASGQVWLVPAKARKAEG